MGVGGRGDGKGRGGCRGRGGVGCGGRGWGSACKTQCNL